MLQSLITSVLLIGVACADPLDTLVFGNYASEAIHGLSAENSDFKTGGLGEPSRRLLPGGPTAWQGGIIKFTIRVDPETQNYFTLRLWGKDVNHNQMTLHVEGKQVGYRHLGDIEALDIGADAPSYPKRPCNQMQTLFLAKAYSTKWTNAAGKPETITKIQTSLDALYRAYLKNPKLAEAEPSTYNPDWFGLGPSGAVLTLLENELKPALDQSIDTGKGRQVKRREAFKDMLVACRDWHREHRRQ